MKTNLSHEDTPYEEDTPMGTHSMRTHHRVLENRLGARETWPEEGALKEWPPSIKFRKY